MTPAWPFDSYPFDAGLLAVSAALPHIRAREEEPPVFLSRAEPRVSRCRRGRERQRQHLRNSTHEMDLDFAANRLRHVLQVRLVPPRQDDLSQSGTVRRQQFLLDATDRQDLALQRNFTGHAQLLTRGALRQQTGQCSDRGREIESLRQHRTCELGASQTGILRLDVREIGVLNREPRQVQAAQLTRCCRSRLTTFPGPYPCSACGRFRQASNSDKSCCSVPDSVYRAFNRRKIGAPISRSCVRRTYSLACALISG